MSGGAEPVTMSSSQLPPHRDRNLRRRLDCRHGDRNLITRGNYGVAVAKGCSPGLAAKFGRGASPLRVHKLAPVSALPVHPDHGAVHRPRRPRQGGPMQLPRRAERGRLEAGVGRSGACRRRAGWPPFIPPNPAWSRPIPHPAKFYALCSPETAEGGSRPRAALRRGLRSACTRRRFRNIWGRTRPAPRACASPAARSRRPRARAGRT